MKVVTYADWKQAVAEQCAKLRGVLPYLNSDGKERFDAFYTLEQFAFVCDSAQELVDWIDDKEAMTSADIASLASKHVTGAIKKLRAIAELYR